jgi:hypothetical protein
MDAQAAKIPGLEYVVEKLADCIDLLARLEDEPETPERERLRTELRVVQRRLLSAACAFGPAERTWLAQ